MIKLTLLLLLIGVLTGCGDVSQPLPQPSPTLEPVNTVKTFGDWYHLNGINSDWSEYAQLSINRFNLMQKVSKFDQRGKIPHNL